MFHKARVHPFWRAQQDRPFAAALAMLLITSPIVTAAGAGLSADPMKALVPPVVFYGLLLTYGVGGLLIFLGIGCGKLNWEAAGCALAVSGLAVRLLALIAVLGFTVPVLTTAVFYFMFGGACVERFVQCVRGDRIVRVNRVYLLEEEGPDDAS